MSALIYVPMFSALCGLFPPKYLTARTPSMLAPMPAATTSMVSPMPSPGNRSEAEHHGGEYGAHVAFKQVRPHARHVAHVIAHVIGDDGGVARIILGYARFHFAHQVRPHVGRLGIDAAAHAAEQRDGACAEGKARYGADVRKYAIHPKQSQRAQAHHGHAQHRAAGKGHV